MMLMDAVVPLGLLVAVVIGAYAVAVLIKAAEAKFAKMLARKDEDLGIKNI
jgi:hypothetical protein